MNKSAWQYFLPQHLLSRLVGAVANCEIDGVKNFLIDQFIERYQVNMDDAEIQNPHQFETFNDFFTRALKPGVRPVDAKSDAIVSPADGTLSEFGQMDEDQLLQAKGQSYSLRRLLANKKNWVDIFSGGSYATIYLAPKDYHRVHMPFGGELLEMVHVPGRLFSVNQQTAQDIPSIFARNERVICFFKTDHGPMAVILVGAMVVASIATPWHGQVTPFLREVQSWDYQPQQSLHLDKGAEMGRFYLGSTAIVLFPKDKITWNSDLVIGQPLKMGQCIGDVLLAHVGAR